MEANFEIILKNNDTGDSTKIELFREDQFPAGRPVPKREFRFKLKIDGLKLLSADHEDDLLYQSEFRNIVWKRVAEGLKETKAPEVAPAFELPEGWK